MSETLTAPTKFHRETVETSRGTEVTSSMGDRIVGAANRIASFMDRMKGARTEVAETAQEKFDQGRAFLQSTGEKAVRVAVKTGKVVGGAALLGLEVGLGAAIVTGRAIDKGASKVDAKLREVDGYITEGLAGGAQYAREKRDAFVASVDQVAGYAAEGIAGGIDFMQQKTTDAKEAVVGKFEAVRGFFSSRAKTAELNIKRMRRNSIARYSQARRGVVNTVESGKAFAQETGENIKHNGRVLRRTGQVAISYYRANSTPAIPR